MSQIISVDQDAFFMRRALELANTAFEHSEVPVGAVVVVDGQVVGEGYNNPIGRNDPSAHAELLAVRSACQNLGNYRLPGATLYVTIEPCTMCLGALMHTRIDRLVYGASEPKAGAVESHSAVLNQPYWNHSFQLVGGVLAAEAAGLMQAFFKMRRQTAKAARALQAEKVILSGSVSRAGNKDTGSD